MQVPTIRINRAIAMSGLASRRAAEQLVLNGKVKLNGKVVRDLATTLDPARDKLEIDGKPLRLQPSTYFAYHKTRGLITTMKDEAGRPCLGDVCAKLPGQPKPVGRLDRASEGLLLLSNDGSLANRLTHPRYGVRKEYQVTVSPRLSAADARRMCERVELDDGPAAFVGIEVLEQERDRSRLMVALAEGRYRLIRRVCEALGYEVLRLKRVRIGPIVLGSLKPGEHRALSGDEVRQLKQLTGLVESAASRQAAAQDSAAQKQRSTSSSGSARSPAPKASPRRPRG